MAIYTIRTLVDAEKIMQKAYLYPWPYVPIIFDLNGSLDPNDVEVSISKCDRCDAVVHFKLRDENEAECPRCRESALRELVVVSLVIQGPVVVATNWRD